MAPRSSSRHPLATLATVAAVLALSGCASLTARQQALPDVAVPAQWSTSAPTPGKLTTLANWWQRYDDPQLTALVTQALQANTTVRSAQAALAQARALRDVQNANLGPTLGASASAQRSKTGDAPAGSRYQSGFDASWEPDVFGGKRAGLSAAEADALASQASLGDTQVSVAAEVAVSYVQLRGLQTRLDIARRNLAAQQETLQITDWRVQAGLATSLELAQARTATEQTRAQIPSLETSVAQTEHALAVLTGQPPTALHERLAPAAPVPMPSGELALDIPAQTLRQRPDIRVAEQQISAALARVSQADAARYPSFNLSGSVGLSALALSGLTGGGSVVSALLGSVSVPLFDDGAAKAQVRSQEAALERARVNYQAVVLNALQEVEDALVALRGNRERLQRLQSASESAQQAALLANQRYSSGLVDFQTVLETQRSLLSTQDSLAATQAELSADHVRLYKALGGGWTSNESAPS
ncbi:efflux transporter outer membrane subunit [Piscinibacter gummiphilus]|uniref:Efflux transporter outer membrane subunit n=1 Tax=Piscinibacter gummiphilus TaxID=946333 RepID=A0ABZ0CTS0_9BURK|nr:efflux transporter outer membrane subunit [Piscinibacter gummiphilus]WOB08357.1 efflux transporter outer membrane subunit [Piscinibacter gummiphilus]